ncbi:MAG: glycosyltransferase [Desulfosarcina sp.]|nr:glycosyltransferase [Desulfobacterales bacterium]
MPENEILNGVNIYRTGGKITEFLRNRLSIKKLSGKKTPGNQESSAGISVRHKAGRLIKCFHDHTWKKVYWPDYACLWYFSAVKKAGQLLTENCYDSFITVSIPFTSHLIGFNLKKKYPQIKWLVDIGDPFCFLEKTPTNNHIFYKKLNYKCEREIFNQSDVIAVTTKPTLEKYAELFPENTSKIYVIPPLLSQINNESISPLFPKNQKLRLVFIGTLYKNIRSPGYLLFLFSKLLNTNIGDRLELHFFGSIHDCHDFFDKYQALLGTKIFLHGQVSREKAAQAIKKSDVLINIGNSTSYQLPSKVVEYASTGKPVLNLVTTNYDSSISFFKMYQPSMNLLEYRDSLFAERIKEVVKFIENPPHLDSATLQQWLSQFKIEAVASSYFRLVRP